MMPAMVDHGGVANPLASLTTTIPSRKIDYDEMSASTSSSVDTDEAFMEMLGLQCSLSEMLDEKEQKNIMHNIALPPRCSRSLHRKCTAFYVDNILSRQECQNLIAAASSAPSAEQKIGFHYVTRATHTAPDGTRLLVDLQKPNPHKLAVLFDHSKMLSRLWFALRDFLPLDAVGLNPKLRVLKYDACDKDRFEPHFDATTVVDDHTSRLSVLLYLNDGNGVDFEGGETLYLNHHDTSGSENRNHHYGSVTKITPQTARVVIFEHDLFHSGAPLLWGTKYVLRTDVMFETAKQDDNKDDDFVKSGNNVDVSSDPAQTSFLVVDLCHELKVSQHEIRILQDMDLLHLTTESFLSPGIKLLKRMLLDGSMCVDTVDKLVPAAVSRVKSYETSSR
jgi:prolyl 4-hydroxylase